MCAKLYGSIIRVVTKKFSARYDCIKIFVIRSFDLFEGPECEKHAVMLGYFCEAL